jgi:hypothetical protein
MKKIIQSMEDNANLIIGLIIILIFIGIIIEIIYLSTRTDDTEIGPEGISSGATREQRDSAKGEGGLGW